MFNYLHRLIADSDGQPSSTRVICLLFYAVVTAVWVWVCLRTKTVADIPNGVAGIGAALALLKGAQSFAEK